MADDLSQGLLTVLGVLAGIAALLMIVAAMDPTNVRRDTAPTPVPGGSGDLAGLRRVGGDAPRQAGGEPAARSQSAA